MNAISIKPYLVKAYYDFLVDCSSLIYVMVDEEYIDKNVPVEYVHDSICYINIDPTKVDGMHITKECMEYTVGVGKSLTQVSIPVVGIEAIFDFHSELGKRFSAKRTTKEKKEPHLRAVPN